MADQIIAIPEVNDILNAFVKDSTAASDDTEEEDSSIDSTDDVLDTVVDEDFSLDTVINSVDSLFEEDSALGNLWNGFKKGALEQGRPRNGARGGQ